MKRWCILVSLFSWAFATGEEPMFAFRTLAYGDGLFEGIFYEQSEDSEVKPVELRFLPNQKSKRYGLETVSGSIDFFRLVERAEGEPQKVKVGQAKIPGGCELALMVFFESADFEQSGVYDILVLDESPDKWRAGCVRFLNLSGVELSGRIGQRPMTLPEGASEIFVFPEEEQVTQPMRFWVPWRGEDRIVFSSRFRPEPNYPMLLVVKPPLDDRSFKVRIEKLW